MFCTLSYTPDSTLPRSYVISLNRRRSLLLRLLLVFITLFGTGISTGANCTVLQRTVHFTWFRIALASDRFWRLLR
jgi:hypothetical protein